MNVLFTPKVHKYAKRLIRILYEEGYFDIFGKGMKYASFKKSRYTTWYVFFKTYEENGKTIYLVRYIANNHTIAQYL